jgi:hypothetical protein
MGDRIVLIILEEAIFCVTMSNELLEIKKNVFNEEAYKVVINLVDKEN